MYLYLNSIKVINPLQGIVKQTSVKIKDLGNHIYYKFPIICISLSLYPLIKISQSKYVLQYVVPQF